MTNYPSGTVILLLDPLFAGWLTTLSFLFRSHFWSHEESCKISSWDVFGQSRRIWTVMVFITTVLRVLNLAVLYLELTNGWTESVLLFRFRRFRSTWWLILQRAWHAKEFTAVHTHTQGTFNEPSSYYTFHAAMRNKFYFTLTRRPLPEHGSIIIFKVLWVSPTIRARLCVTVQECISSHPWRFQFLVDSLLAPFLFYRNGIVQGTKPVRPWQDESTVGLITKRDWTQSWVSFAVCASNEWYNQIILGRANNLDLNT